MIKGSLKAFKKAVNINQMNNIRCEVLIDFDDYSTVRTPEGKTVRANKEPGTTFRPGSGVDVRTDLKTYNIIGASSYSDYAAEKSYAL